jgi:hypothetical protein|tara:strand:- start:397 stop:726 length:330 start_codon:yes stop_codon:yes gene_type:complete
MNVVVDQTDVNQLDHTAHKSFWNEHRSMFELVKSSDSEIDEEHPPTGGFMLWAGDNYLNALIIYNWYLSRVAGNECAILWDMSDDGEYCVWVGIYGEWPDYYLELKRVE